MDFTQEELANEIWKPIKGFEARYEISSLGRVRSLNYMRTGRIQILRPSVKKMGYKEVSLLKEGKTTYMRVARLVAETFIPNPENKPCVDHIDTNPKNNRATNLRWVTYSENVHNPITYERFCKAAKGRNLGRKTSEETKKKLSILNKGANNHFFGKKHTVETRQRLSEYKRSEEHIRKSYKPVVQYALTGEKIKEWVSIKIAAQTLNINESCIGKVAKGRRESYKGYIWKYADNPDEIFDRYFADKKKK